MVATIESYPVTAIYNAEEVTLPTGAVTVATVRQTVKALMNVPNHARPRLNGAVVQETAVVGPQEILEFIVPWGWKGMSDDADTRIRCSMEDVRFVELRRRVLNNEHPIAVILEVKTAGAELTQNAEFALMSLLLECERPARPRIACLSDDELDKVAARASLDGSLGRKVRDEWYYSTKLARRRSVALLEKFRCEAYDWQVPLIERRIEELVQLHERPIASEKRRAIRGKVDSGELRTKDSWLKAHRRVLDDAMPNAIVPWQHKDYAVYSIEKTVPVKSCGGKRSKK